MWSQNLRLQRTLKTGTDSCRARDLWVTNYVPLHNVNKIALSFTSKEIGACVHSRARVSQFHHFKVKIAKNVSLTKFLKHNAL